MSESSCQVWNPDSARAPSRSSPPPPPAGCPMALAPPTGKACRPDVPDGRGGKHLPFGAHAEDDHGGHDHDEVWGGSGSPLSPARRLAQGKEPGGQAGQGPTKGTQGRLIWETQPSALGTCRACPIPPPSPAHRLLRASDAHAVPSISKTHPVVVSEDRGPDHRGWLLN